MATDTVKGTNKTLIDAGGLTSQLAAGLQDGRVKCAIDQYVADGTEEATTIIEMFGDLPAGAKVISIMLRISATESGFTVSVGDTETATRYISASADLDTADDILTLMGKGYVIGSATADSQIELLTGGATLTAATIIYGAILYTTD